MRTSDKGLDGTSEKSDRRKKKITKNMVLKKTRAFSVAKQYDLPLWCYITTLTCALINGLMCAVLALDFMTSFVPFYVAACCAAAGFACNIITFAMGGSKTLFDLTQKYQELFSNKKKYLPIIANLGTCALFYTCGINSWVNTLQILGVTQSPAIMFLVSVLSFSCSLANLILLCGSLVKDETPKQASRTTQNSNTPANIKVLCFMAGSLQALSFSLVLCHGSYFSWSTAFPNQPLMVAGVHLLAFACCFYSQFGFYTSTTRDVIKNSDTPQLLKKKPQSLSTIVSTMILLNAAANACIVASGNFFGSRAQLFLLAPTGLFCSAAVNIRSGNQFMEFINKSSDPSFASEYAKTLPNMWLKSPPSLDRMVEEHNNKVYARQSLSLRSPEDASD